MNLFGQTGPNIEKQSIAIKCGGGQYLTDISYDSAIKDKNQSVYNLKISCSDNVGKDEVIARNTELKPTKTYSNVNSNGYKEIYMYSNAQGAISGIYVNPTDDPADFKKLSIFESQNNLDQRSIFMCNRNSGDVLTKFSVNTIGTNGQFTVKDINFECSDPLQSNDPLKSISDKVNCCTKQKTERCGQYVPENKQLCDQYIPKQNIVFKPQQSQLVQTPRITQPRVVAVSNEASTGITYSPMPYYIIGGASCCCFSIVILIIAILFILNSKK